MSRTAGLCSNTIREAALLQMVRCRHVMRSEGAFLDRSTRRMCIVMPAMLGGTALSATKRAPPGIPEVRQLMRSCLLGLAGLHARGIVHRDVKPPNILLARRGDWGSAVITDLGSAQVSPSCLPPDHNTAGVHYCTPWFQAPENLRDVRAPYLPSGDVWSLAACACYLADGARRQPWFVTTPTADPPLPRPDDIGRLVFSLGTKGVDLVTHMLDPDPSRRPSARRALTHPFLL